MRELGDRPGDLRAQSPDALVVAGLLGQVGEQMPEPVARQREELPIVGQPEQHLADRQGDQLGVGDPRRMSRARPGRKEVVDLHVKCSRKGVEVGVHAASMVDVAETTPPFDALVMSPRRRPRARPNTESTV